MITGLSKAVALYLAPLLALTSTILSILVFLAPSITLHTQVALLNVQHTGSGDGPALWLGVIGSCSQTGHDGPLNCTSPSVAPTYDLSVIAGKAPALLTAPTAATPAFLALSLVFTLLFFMMFTMISLRHKLGKIGAAFEKPMMQRVSAWIGLFGFMMGLSAYLVLRLWFSKAVEDFNTTAAAAKEPFIASTGNGFIMVWVAYAFYAVPLVCALAKLHVTATAGK
jgi:hypothetical protein